MQQRDLQEENACLQRKIVDYALPENIELSIIFSSISSMDALHIYQGSPFVGA
ncbi:hypothetical protein QJS10_CPA10g01593 [Acorus calamus]|uniref:Uncharacterized protein n=1 Tax=Acorus calamus TaxID=4465 RepID=A0AAV9DY96_ACOCL|nr:hypothetical protein QJS10_CPA10g01593 [Acorus calamus]